MKLKFLVLFLILGTSLFGQYRNQYGRILIDAGINRNGLRQSDTLLETSTNLNLGIRLNLNKKKNNESASYFGIGYSGFSFQKENKEDLGYNNAVSLYAGISDEEDWSLSPRAYYLFESSKLATELQGEITPFDNILGIENLDLAFNIHFGFLHNLKRDASPTLYVGAGVSAHYYFKFYQPYFKVNELKPNE